MSRFWVYCIPGKHNMLARVFPAPAVVLESNYMSLSNKLKPRKWVWYLLSLHQSLVPYIYMRHASSTSSPWNNRGAVVSTRPIVMNHSQLRLSHSLLEPACLFMIWFSLNPKIVIVCVDDTWWKQKDAWMIHFIIRVLYSTSLPTKNALLVEHPTKETRHGQRRNKAVAVCKKR